METKSTKAPLYRLVVLGDGGVGKTALTIQLCLQHFVESYDPTIEDSYRRQALIDGKTCILEVLDTAGQEEYTSLRDQWIRDGNGFLLVYSITSASSFDKIESFFEQIRKVKEGQDSPQNSPVLTSPNGRLPVILVGNKSDRMSEREVSVQKGEALAARLGCDFTEASARTAYNVEHAFFSVARMVRQASMPEEVDRNARQRGLGIMTQDSGRRKRRCVIL